MTRKLFTLCLLAAALLIGAAPARAARDAVQFGSNIHVARNTAVHDAVCFFCNVRADGEIEGNVVVFFGSIQLAGNAHHDVVSFFGSVTAADGVQIGNNLVSMFGGIHLGENVSVAHDMVAIFGSIHAPESVTVGNNRVVQPAWLLSGPLIFFILVVVLIAHELGAHRRRRMMRGYPLPPMP
jgi:predicted acyltransferase (DUF342 family)